MTEIQEKIAKKGRRNLFSRLVHAENDKGTIAAWKSDLNGFLHVFNVRFVVSTWLSLTVPFQAELAVGTHVTVSEVRHDVSGIRHDVSGIRDDVSKIREDIGDNVRSVSASCVQSINNKMFTVA